MKTPLIRRSPVGRNDERGVTIALVAIAMVAIIAMAALSIDVITLYLSKEEAQRSADAAALAAAKIVSVSGITGDPNNVSGNWGVICGPDDGTNGLATRVAKAVANQNYIGGGPATTPAITYSSGGSSSGDCTQLSATGFGVNPVITIQLQRTGLPTFFSRIWGNTGNNISATATAEVFNPSNSANSGSTPTGTIIPVQPRCVKPWVVPNQNPLDPGPGAKYCNQNGGPGSCNPIVDLSTGQIHRTGISLNGTGTNGIIGETFWLAPDCHFPGASCTLRKTSPTYSNNIPQANFPGSAHVQAPPNLLYVPGQVGTSVIGVPSCTSGDQFEEAIEGCDQPTNYSCGVAPANGGTNVLDLSRNPDSATSNGVACLVNQADNSNVSGPTGQDYLTPFMLPSSYPFQISAGSSNPLVGGGGLVSGTPVSVSASIVSLPIYDQTDPNATLSNGGTTNVTFVGFLQVFINAVDQFGNVSVTVLNVAACGNGQTTPVANQPVIANSPVPIRLITPP